MAHVRQWLKLWWGSAVPKLFQATDETVERIRDFEKRDARRFKLEFTPCVVRVRLVRHNNYFAAVFEHSHDARVEFAKVLGDNAGSGNGVSWHEACAITGIVDSLQLVEQPFGMQDQFLLFSFVPYCCDGQQQCYSGWSNKEV